MWILYNLIKDEEKTEKLSNRAIEFEKFQSNIWVLSEMLVHYNQSTVTEAEKETMSVRHLIFYLFIFLFKFYFFLVFTWWIRKISTYFISISNWKWRWWWRTWFVLFYIYYIENIKTDNFLNNF